MDAATAARELLARRRARDSLIAFTEYTLPQYEPAAHHHAIAQTLEDVERGDCLRAAIFVAPRHGKSELASRRGPAWMIGRNPSIEVISASYNSDLASDFGRDVRDIVASPEFGNVFPGVQLRQDSRAADRWQTSAGGAYRSAGVGTAMTGRGADVLLIDDPLKDRAEADSEVTRNRVWSWYTSTAYTRLSPNGRIVLIQTRWHDDDLAGRILNGPEGKDWRVISLPALDDQGRALWPERYDEAALARIRGTIGPREWQALYMQRPQADEGDFFRREWFRRFNDLPSVRRYMTTDYAVTDGGGDYTVMRIWGVAASGDIYLIDGWRGQATADVWIERQCDLIRKHKPLACFGEAGVIQKAIEPMLRRAMRERGVHCRLEWLPSINDKPTRARGFQSRAAMGRVWMPEGPVGDLVIDEMARFPAGVHDDEVDCASLLGRALDEVHPALGERKAAPERGPKDFRAGRAKRSEGVDWKTI